MKNVRTIVVEIISVLFIMLFLYASLSKLLDYGKFRVQLGQSPLLTQFAGWMIWAVPALEIVIVGMLAIHKLRSTGLYGSFALMILFTGYIIAITKFSEFIPCSCGGILQNMSWGQHLHFNLGFVILGVVGVLINWAPSTTQRN
jgi:hypothetical protein